MIKVISLSLLVFGFQFTAFSQLKKKKFGTYEGKIPSYELNTGFKQIEVDQAPISVTITADSLFINIGNQELKGSHLVILQTKDYTILEGKMEEQAAVERILVYTKKKMISREGIKPQPDAILTLKKK